MRWPWVSRAELDRAVDELRVQRERYDGLLSVVLGARLNMTQAASTPAVPLRSGVAHKTDRIADAIMLKAGGSTLLRRQLAGYAKRRRAEGASQTQIATELLEWRDATVNGWSDDDVA